MGPGVTERGNWIADSPEFSWPEVGFEEIKHNDIENSEKLFQACLTPVLANRPISWPDSGMPI